MVLVIPEPLHGGQKLESLAKTLIRSAELLEKWLNQKNVDTSSWGTAPGSKSVDSLYNEIKGDEAGLELWKTSDGSVRPVRVTHVLRAKVTSPEAYRRNVFLFNTWQQFGDGRTRVRNGLLSEKLTLAEMPFEKHMMDICCRAVTEEEMQRVVDNHFRVDKDVPVEFDEKYVCPLKVEEAHLIDHTIEVEESKSFLGLLTLYHLYTVDIVCSNLPVVDFNTLEFTHPDEAGRRKLKYVHAWVWLKWPQIKRYLLDGSKLKEKKTKGSFPDANSLSKWLSQFNLDLQEWGHGRYKTVASLFAELEAQSASLELWGRQDGVPLVMRVVHVIQVRLQSSDFRLGNKLLVQKWAQNQNLQLSYVERPFAKKLSTRHNFSDITSLSLQARAAVKDELAHIADSHFEFEGSDFSLDSLPKSGVEPCEVEYLRHWTDCEESPSFKGMFTMYHMYAFGMVCDNLPPASFTSVHRSGDGSLRRTHWQWSTWEGMASVVSHRQALFERREARRSEQLEGLEATFAELASSVDTLATKVSPDDKGDAAAAPLKQYVEVLEKELAKLKEIARDGDDGQLARQLPPSMVSKLAGQTIAPESMLQQSARLHQLEASLSEPIKE